MVNFTGYSFNGKPLASLSIGCMRFPSREAAAEIIQACVAQDVTYLDTCAMYCHHSPEENSETWTGAAIQGLRDKVIVSAKCSTGNGGDEIGQCDPARGFSIVTADQVRRQIDQSLRNLKVDSLDCYQLWAIHAPKLFDEALKPGGWIEGALKARDEGLFAHLGVTGHGDSAEIRRWIDSGLFETITVPFHMLDRSRLEGIEYARQKGVAVIAMNPLAGGLLGGPSAPLAQALAGDGVTSASDMALRYCAAFARASALSGMTSPQEAAENAASLSKPPWSEEQAEQVRASFDALRGQAESICTGCKYCLPCPQGLDIPGILALRNCFLVLNLESARANFQERYKWWGDAYKADRCTACGECESKCPNALPVSQLMRETTALLGPG